jgi:NAD+ synthase (glutamine-hydrolysing)
MLNITLAQLNFTVGALDQNANKIIAAVKQAQQEHQAEIVVFAELALSGYPPEDLLLRDDFLHDTQLALTKICKEIPHNIITIVGYPEKTLTGVYNSAAIIQHNKIIANHRKQCLPNYTVFDEERYFNHGQSPCVFTYNNIKIGLTICEDLWFTEPVQQIKQVGAQLLISINASPFYEGKIEKRLTEMRKRVHETQLPLLYVNQCCGQDDLIFDGSSFALDATGKITAQAPFVKEALLPIIIDDLLPSSSMLIASPPREAQLYQALVLGVSDYVLKNNFKKALLGFSGGIDSSLTLAIAADALGKENVLPVILPSRFTSNLSVTAAHQQLKNMGVNYQEISIEPSFSTFLTSLSNNLTDITTQNIQARCRAVILMALSNQTGAMLLNTSNKSEMAVGYGTLYGDMCGGYAILKDVWKTEVYKLAHYRNTLSPIIPQEIIDRPPTAELSANQLDTDNLPPYNILDPLLQRYIEEDQSIAEIIAAGFAEQTVRQITKLVKDNEYKRKQHAPGPKITKRAFSRERRYPITSGY